MHEAQRSNVIHVNFDRTRKAAKVGWSEVRRLRVTRAVLLAGWVGTVLGYAFKEWIA